MRRKWIRGLLIALAVLLGGPPVLILIGTVVPPLFTPLPIIRSYEGEGFQRDWVPLEAIDRDLVRAVIAAEDMKFCVHSGFDVEAMRQAYEDWQRGRPLRGASTITMQTAKNLFLWPGRDPVRKLYEAYITVWLELIWSKERIIEVYLNVIEWGPGIYGAEAGAQAAFRHGADRLTAREAALMAAVLPNPRRWSPAKPTGHIQGRARTIERRMRDVVLPEGGVCP